MLQYEICIPNVSEQRQIADVLIKLDNLITLHQLKLEKLKNIKQSLLQNMFV
jgi:type I restriction enzyme S subunit